MEIYKNLDVCNLENEIWKDILDYEGDYQVSNIGRVKSLKFGKERILRQCKSSSGYLQINLCQNGQQKPKLIHHLVYETHKGKMEKGYDIHHINEDEEDNCVENLEEKLESIHVHDHHKNKKHSEKTKIKISNNHVDVKGINNPMFGIKRLGEKNPNKKLTNEKVIQIKMLFKLNFKNKEISDIYKVCEMTIHYIKIGKIWNNIKLENINDKRI